MKMVLIPESEYKRLKPEEGMKAKVNKILRGKRDKKSATEMTQLFGRYLRTSKPEKEIQTLTKEEIVENLPPMYHEKVKKFLTQLQTYGSTWTDSFQFVSKSGQSIGNIINLLKEAFVGSRGLRRDVPQGWDQFIQEIVAADIPRATFSKKTTKNDFDREKAKKTRALSIAWENY